MRYLFYLISVLSATASATGQDSAITLPRTPRAVLKLAPLSLIDRDATVQAGLEYRVGPKTSVQAEFGYGWQGLSVLETELDQFVKAEIWRARSEVRFYTGRYRTNRQRRIAVRSNFPLGNYWAVDGLAKQINVTGRAYERTTESGTGLRSIGLMTTRRYVVGTHLKLGRQFTFYDPYKRRFARTLFDVYVGAGIRWAVNEVRRKSQTAEYQSCRCGVGPSFTAEGAQWAPSLTAGLKVGYAL